MDNVSRETIIRLDIYRTLLTKWQKKFNLVSNDTMSQLWGRHFEDSLQVLKYITHDPQSIIDLGSGAGFPGMVLAIALLDKAQVTLIESDANKCTFLENVSRETNAPVEIINKRIEEVKNIKGEVITSRALASLTQLLEYSSRLVGRDSIMLFHKGKKTKEEIDEAQKKWNFELEIFPSLTDSTGNILMIKNLRGSP